MTDLEVNNEDYDLFVGLADQDDLTLSQLFHEMLMDYTR